MRYKILYENPGYRIMKVEKGHELYVGKANTYVAAKNLVKKDKNKINDTETSILRRLLR